MRRQVLALICGVLLGGAQQGGCFFESLLGNDTEETTSESQRRMVVNAIGFSNMMSNTTLFDNSKYAHLFVSDQAYLMDQWPDLLAKSSTCFIASKYRVQTKAVPWHHYQLTEKLRQKDVLLESWRWTLDHQKKTFLPLSPMLGTGVDIFIIDSGIDVSHPEFNGRAQTLMNYYRAPRSCYEHGTAVASAAGGLVGGLAKNSPLYSVTVGICPDHVANTDGDEFSGIASGGRTDDVIKALEDISKFRARQHATFCAMNNLDENVELMRPAVINISLGVPNYTTPDFFRQQLERVLVAGRTVITAAAGNEAQNASKLWPANEPSIICVGSYNQDFIKAGFSNRGMLVDMYGPGSKPLLASIHAPLGYEYFKGTSFAAPYVAGFCAAYWSLNTKMMAIDVENVARSAFYKDEASMHEVE